jgi:hypothetical protein
MKATLRAAAVLALGLAASAHAREIQLFDTQIFGKPTSEPVKLLLDKTGPDDVEPRQLWTDVRCGKYFAASVFYPKPTTFAEVRGALDKTYAGWALPISDDSMGLWRVESQQLAVSLFDSKEDGVNAIYIWFDRSQAGTAECHHGQQDEAPETGSAAVPGALKTAAQARRVQLFDAQVLGQHTSEPVKLLLDKTGADDVEPLVLWFDVACGRYVAANAWYDKPTTFAGLWHVQDEHAVVRLSDENEAQGGAIALSYLHLFPGKQWARPLGPRQFDEAAKELGLEDCSAWAGLTGAGAGGESKP